MIFNQFDLELHIKYIRVPSIFRYQQVISNFSGGILHFMNLIQNEKYKALTNYNYHLLGARD